MNRYILILEDGSEELLETTLTLTEEYLGDNPGTEPLVGMRPELECAIVLTEEEYGEVFTESGK